MLGSALGSVATVAGATVAVVAAAGFAAFKLGDNRAKSAASIGRTASIIGVATDALQKLSAAAERVGVDKDTAAGALGIVSQTLNDAAYGRNGQALGLLTKMGVKMRRSADGTVDVEAMLPDIANAIARQNSSGRRTAAGMLGIPLSALPAFSQGGAALSADMAAAAKEAYIASPASIGKAVDIVRKGAIAGQRFDAGKGWAGERAALVTDVGYGAVPAVTDALGKLPSAATVMDRAARTFETAATRLGNAIIGRPDIRVPSLPGRSYRTTAAVVDAIHRAALASGVDESALRSIAAQESGLNPTKPAGTGPALGLYQFIPQTWLGAIKQYGAKYGQRAFVDAISGSPGRYRVADTALAGRILAARTDPFLSSALTGELMRAAAPALNASTGHSSPTAGDLYMNHFLGPSAAARFFRAERANPNADAAAMFPREAAANPGVFAPGGRDRSLAEVLRVIEQWAQRPVGMHITAPPGTKAEVRHPGGAIGISHADVGR